jgi:hypothetical protein
MDFLDRLKKLPPSKYHVHETEVCQMIQIKATDGGVSARGKLSQLILALRLGRGGCMVMDLKQGLPSACNIHPLNHGKQEAFATDLLSY